MKITKVRVKKFRGFEDTEFELGTHLTAISGQNGTQKTTLLGMLSQPFSLEYSPMKAEKPLSGGSFRSQLDEKFRISKTFDKPNDHEWSLEFDNGTHRSFKSYKRPEPNLHIRFVPTGSRKKGEGYEQLPVVFLSLRRLYPIAEDSDIKPDKSFTLTEKEREVFKSAYEKILILTRKNDQILTTNLVKGNIKHTLGVNTDHYDWESISAGQDNVGKILLAILSFRRLQKTYPDQYQGGILAIDELDATLYPASQIELIRVLNKYAKQYNIQIIFTTHSLTILEEVSTTEKNEEKRQGQFKTIFLKKADRNITIVPDVSFSYIQHHLNISLSEKKEPKIDLFCEDPEGYFLLKTLIRGSGKFLKYYKISLGCGELLRMGELKVPCFSFPNSIVILDGDMSTRQYNQVSKLRNYLVLPGNNSPERILATFLNSKSDIDPMWLEINEHFSHQYCFRKFSYEEIMNDRKKAKEWFIFHKKNSKKSIEIIVKHWKEENKQQVDEFRKTFKTLLASLIQ